MTNEKPLSLSRARKQNRVSEFIAANETNGNEAAFNRALASMARKSKEAPEASPRGSGDD